MAVQWVRRCGLSAGLQSSCQPPIPRSQHGIQSGRTRFEHGPGGREETCFGKLPLGNGAGGPGGQRLGELRLLGNGAAGKRLGMAAPLCACGNSLIGYDSLYAKDNFTYTRPWGGDYTPYIMFGVNASYPFSKKITVTAFRSE